MGSIDDLIGALIEPLHGLLLCGGPDIDPRRYGSAPHPTEGPNDENRDAFELRLLELALARDLPVLGICRGMQMLNVSLGGSLHQHLATASSHSAGPGQFTEHDVAVESESRLARTIGTRASVFSYHHQGVDRLGADLRATAWAPDGGIEAIEKPSAQFLIGVLWHPEMSSDRSLFRALVKASRG